jgi:membrane-associated phospholipid phosphatase
MSESRSQRIVPAGPPERRFGLRALLAASALVLVAVPFGLLLFLVQDKWSPLARADAGARDDLHSYAVQNESFVSAMRVLSTLGSTSVWVAVFALVVAWLLWRRLPRLALFVLVTVAGSSLLNQVVKVAVDRSRPVLPNPVEHANGMSFPSGHAQAAIVGYAVLLLVFLPVVHGGWRRMAGCGAVLLVLAIGFSRVALGVHYVSDVLAGYILGAAWVAAMTAAFNAWRVERGKPKVAPKEGLEPEAADQLSPSDDVPQPRR